MNHKQTQREGRRAIVELRHIVTSVPLGEPLPQSSHERMVEVGRELWQKFVILELERSFSFLMLPNLLDAVVDQDLYYTLKDWNEFELVVKKIIDAKQTLIAESELKGTGYWQRQEQKKELEVFVKEWSTLKKFHGMKVELMDFLEFDSLKNEKISIVDLKQLLKKLDEKIAAISKEQFADSEFQSQLYNNLAVFRVGLSEGISVMEHLDKKFSVNKIAKERTSHKFIMAAAFATAFCAIVATPLVVLGAALRGGELGVTIPNNNQYYHGDVLAEIFVLSVLTFITLAVGSVIGAILGIPIAIAAGAHYVRRTTNEDYAWKTEFLYKLERAEKIFDAQIRDLYGYDFKYYYPNYESQFDVVDKYIKILYETRTEHTKLSKIDLLKVDKDLSSELMAELKLLFKIRFKELAIAIDMARHGSRTQTVKELKSMLQDIESDFKKLVLLIKKKEIAPILDAIEATVAKVEKEIEIENEFVFDPTKNIAPYLPSDYIQEAMPRQIKFDVVQSLRHKLKPL